MTYFSLKNNLPKNTENSRPVGLQRDGSFYGNLSECKETLGMLVACVESGEMPQLCM